MTTRAPKTRTAPVPEEILEITTSDPVEEAEERRTLFRIDGEDYTVPKIVDERIVFLAMNYMRTEGPLFGVMYLTQLMLGETQFSRLTALLEQRRITHKQFDELVGQVNDLFFNRAKDAEGSEPEGKASTASPSS